MITVLSNNHTSIYTVQYAKDVHASFKCVREPNESRDKERSFEVPRLASPNSNGAGSR